MFETKEMVRQLALLAAVDTGEYDVEESLDELEELAHSAGAEVVGRVTQRREAFDPATCIGAGRLQEMADFIEAEGANLIIFDHELTASQLRNIEKVCDCAVIDRTTLILDIFAQRATTSEGRLQVELAQQRYRLPRLAGLGTSWAAASVPAARAKPSWKATAGTSAAVSTHWSASWRPWPNAGSWCTPAAKRTAP